MAVNTKNKYGNISISNYAIAAVAGHVVSECYGVDELVSRRFADGLIKLFNKIPSVKGVKIETVDNKINAKVYVQFKSGVNVGAVCDSVSNTAKYHIEDFTGMRVNTIDVHVVSAKA